MGMLTYIACSQDKTLYELGKTNIDSHLIVQFRRLGNSDLVIVIDNRERLLFVLTRIIEHYDADRICDEIWKFFGNKEIVIVNDVDDSVFEKQNEGYQQIGSVYEDLDKN